MSEKRLFENFPPISTEAWEEKIKADLKGADYNRTLIWKTNENIDVKPYYRAEHIENIDFTDAVPGAFPFVRGNKTIDNSWLIRQNIATQNIAKANKTALDVLNKGVNSLGFVFDKTQKIEQADMDILLKDIFIEGIETNFVACRKSIFLFPMFKKIVEERGLKADSIHTSFDIDPIGKLTLTGGFYKGSEKEAFEEVKQLIVAAKDFPHVKTIGVRAWIYKEAGVSIVQELAFALAAGNEYLAKLTEMGLPIGAITERMKFNFSTGTNYFMEIAKIRAARLLWANIVKQYNPCCDSKTKMHIHAETSLFTDTVYDPYVNMLRATTESMSAVLGNVESFAVNPFDASYSESSVFGERVARNVQILLKEESYLDKVIDPAAGSYYIENITNSIVDEAWKLFLEIEEKGGYIEAFKQGFVQQQIAEMAAKRNNDVANRRENLLGTNQFPNFEEKIDERIDFSALQAKNYEKAENAIAEPIKIYRLAQGFEQVRYQTDKAAKRPVTFMLTFGNLAMRKARAAFSCNFFACAGYKVIDNLGFASAEEGVKAAKAAGADIVVVCSSDEEYTEFAPQVKSLLDKEICVIAGFPKDAMETLKAAGIEHFIHVKTNVLESLQNFNQLLFKL